MAGSELYFDQDEHIDGIVYLACFGCGPDSLIGEIIERRMNKPFIMLTVDEHTGETGLLTRLEAFVDMIERQGGQLLKITFPHMGNAHIAIKALLAGLKLEVIPPPPITKRTMELGIKHSPEFACLPLKSVWVVLSKLWNRVLIRY